MFWQQQQPLSIDGGDKEEGKVKDNNNKGGHHKECNQRMIPVAMMTMEGNLNI